MLDIDDFKYINDHFGHIKGDEVLIKVTQLINETIRKIDTVGRYGGEEFLVVFPNTDLLNTQNASDRIRTKIENTDFTGIGRITVSGGYIEFNEETIEELIDKADQNLYEAKKTGKNKVIGNLLK